MAHNREFLTKFPVMRYIIAVSVAYMGMGWFYEIELMIYRIIEKLITLLDYISNLYGS